MVKEGDRFKDGKTGKVYKVKTVSGGRIILETENDPHEQIVLDQVNPEATGTGRH